MSAGSKRVRKHNRERGPCLLTASPSDGPGVRRFSPPAIALRRRGKSLPCFLVETGQGGISPMCNRLVICLVVTQRHLRNLRLTSLSDRIKAREHESICKKMSGGIAAQ